MQRWPEIRALFERAIEHPRETREPFVRANAADAALAEAVLALLARESDPTLQDITEPVSRGDSLDLPEGTRIAGFRLRHPIGRGGMGVVYLAEQEQPRRRVALKLLSGLHSGSALARFRREADALARLSHPGIAQVHAAGADSQGRPYLALEYVEGQHLIEAAAGLDRRQRMALLARVADAVEHAHAQGIVHRDLKPSNILVRADGQPKVLDFGIARSAEDSAEPLTETGALLGTPAYMSPERARGESTLDARADVYALGVLGYELLAGRPPVAVSGLTPWEALRAVEEATPAPLSRLDNELRGDLETVIATAMAREPSLRYASAGALADDLRRWLAHEPIRARRPPALRRALLFARRRPGLVAAGALAALSLLVGAGLALMFAVSEARQRSEAEAALQRAEATLDSLSKVLSAGNPSVSGRPSVEFAEVLNSAPSQLEGLPPEIALPVRYRLALSQASLGQSREPREAFKAIAAKAAEHGMPGLAAQARARAVFLSADVLSPSQFMAELQRELEAPELSAYPVARRFLHGQMGLMAVQMGAADVARVQYEASRALGAAALAQAPEAGDIALAAEGDIDELALGLFFLLQSTDIANESGDYLDALRAADARWRPALGEGHPSLEILSLISDALPDAVNWRSAWRDRALDGIERDLERLGPTHPSVSARLSAVWWLLSVQGSYDNRFIRVAARVLGSMPRDSRRTLQLALVVYGSPIAHTLPGTIDELEAIAAPHCPNTAPLEVDCAVFGDVLTRLLLARGEFEEAIQRSRALAQRADEVPVRAGIEFKLALGFTLQRAGRYEEAMAQAERTLEALQSTSEFDQAESDRLHQRIAWVLRPHGCARALSLIEPRIERLLTYPEVPTDALMRIWSTCEVRAGRDPAVALARLDAWWQRASAPGTDLSVRAELVNAYLEIHHVLGDSEAFRVWAQELWALQDAGYEAEALRKNAMPWIERALACRARPRCD